MFLFIFLFKNIIFYIK